MGSNKPGQTPRVSANQPIVAIHSLTQGFDMPLVNVVLSTTEDDTGADLVVGPYDIQLVHVSPYQIQAAVQTVLQNITPNLIMFPSSIPAGQYTVQAQKRDLFGAPVGNPVYLASATVTGIASALNLSITL